MSWNVECNSRIPLVPECIAAQAGLRPDAIALIDPDGAMSYGQLEARSIQLASQLAALGVTAETTVGILLPRSFEMVISLLAVWRADGAYVPLDLASPSERLKWLVEDAELRVLITNSGRSLPTGLPKKLPILDPASITGKPAVHLQTQIDPRSLAYLIYTSGSTGKPKGVAVHHDALANYVSWACESYRVGEGTCALAASPIAFDLTVTSLLAPLAGGGCVAIPPEGEGLDETFRRIKAGWPANLFKLTPSHLRAIQHQGGAESVDATVVVGGEALLFGHLSGWPSGTSFVNEYGPTETVVGCCAYRVDPDRGGRGPVPIGQPITGVDLYVEDAPGEAAPLASSGELAIGGVAVARGYWRRPALTAEKFVPDPYSGRAGARLYLSGDIVRRSSDGSFEYMGRRDAQIKIRGFRVEPGEVEAALLECPGVADAAVIPRQDTPGVLRLVGYVAMAPGAGFNPAELREALEVRLPDYMVPAAFVPLARLPLTPNGKLDRNALPAAATAAEADVPETPMEQLVADVWAKVFQTERIGREENFFELGGDSILAMAIAAHLRRKGLAMSPQYLWEAQTIAAMARLLTSHASRRVSSRESDLWNASVSVLGESGCGVLPPGSSSADGAARANYQSQNEQTITTSSPNGE
jgi:amino acid adenylation domain-containing protein